MNVKCSHWFYCRKYAETYLVDVDAKVHLAYCKDHAIKFERESDIKITLEGFLIHEVMNS
jgi:hypothetical protein